ncbi:MAG: EamA family transporter [Candidatus Hodarchaeales archaeon]|jgi:drug/metabolite transporter (DMT)-like permease
MNSESQAISYGLASAIIWGAGDFSGGLATKRSKVLNVIFISQIVGVTFLIGLALIFSENIPSLIDLLLGCLAGFFGCIGLIALYRGLAVGKMGMVAPISAIVTVVVPLIFGFLIEGIPPLHQLFGFGIAFIAVWFISQTGNKERITFQDFHLPIVAGIGFGLFFILIDRVSDSVVFWPLITARITSLGFLFASILFMKQKKIPPANQLPIIALAGIFDVCGNAFFVLATQLGRLDVAVVLASLYPAGTVLLAWIILKEKMYWQQWIGLIASLIAIILISI